MLHGRGPVKRSSLVSGTVPADLVEPCPVMHVGALLLHQIFAEVRFTSCSSPGNEKQYKAVKATNVLASH